MDWMIGMQKAIDYIEAHLTEPIDYDIVAAQSFSSSYHFQRVFSILCGFTIGEYIRSRRLSLAGTELLTSDSKVIDVALKYGNVMNYRIEKKPEMIFTGYKKRFTGTPAERKAQECEFYVSTRANQYILKGLSHDCDTGYNIMDGFGDDGYDLYIASVLDAWSTDNLDKELGEEEAKRFEKIVVPAGLYLICETDKTNYPTTLFEDLRKKMVSEWLPSSGYRLTKAPEISVYHWFYKQGDAELNNSRYIELWLPIEKCE